MNVVVVIKRYPLERLQISDGLSEFVPDLIVLAIALMYDRVRECILLPARLTDCLCSSLYYSSRRNDSLE
jgi:hypothetical protein